MRSERSCPGTAGAKAATFAPIIETPRPGRYGLEELDMNSLGHALRLCALLTAAVAGGVLAQARPATPAECHNIASGAERLACYDAVSGRPAEPRKEAAPVAQPPAPVAASGTSLPARAKASMIDEAWDFDPSSPAADIRYYHSNYLLVGRYTNNVNFAPYLPLFEAAGKPEELNSTEAKFQISFKGRLWTTDDRRWGVWAAYTQQNQWQVYNGDVSRPFRETNYMPELLVSYRPDVDLGGGFRWGVVNAGYNHQSNGRADVLSRSWDRIFAEFGVERDSLMITGRLWYRLKPDASDDDNPDITDYYGSGAIAALYRWRGNSFSIGGRGNLRTGKGAVQAAWTSPPFLGPLRGYVQVFSGYGESLIDYNWKQTTIGAGVALSDGL
jgi:phospholipase A1